MAVAMVLLHVVGLRPGDVRNTAHSCLLRANRYAFYALVQIFLLFVAALQVFAAVTDHIQAVENGLLPPVVIKGRPVELTNIAERMKALNVRGVSIAVINNYEIEWAKGYGSRIWNRSVRLRLPPCSKPDQSASRLRRSRQ